MRVISIGKANGERKPDPAGLNVSINVNKANFPNNVDPSEPGAHSGESQDNGDSPKNGSPATSVSFSPPSATGSRLIATILGTTLAIGFYAIATTVSWAPLQRYFLGHPVAVAATVLFWMAMGILISKWLGIAAQSNQLAAIRDQDLMPRGVGKAQTKSPADRWLTENDAGFVSRQWLHELSELPSTIRGSHLVCRLQEVLVRQSQRGSTKHLADDLRELSSRDADTAHDSIGLVRIIVWAIPMLGFLGTVIGITQTLGGLDFSNGTAAVDSLKGGLYVAFDTTALGLVLSVVAIFLQFPIERSEQRLLGEIDARVGYLVSASLPSDQASDNQTVLIGDLFRGIQAAVAESLDKQTRLWRKTIDAAQQQWQVFHQQNENGIVDAFSKVLVPGLVQHAKSLSESSRVNGDHLQSQCDRWAETLGNAQALIERASESTTSNVVRGIETTLQPALRDHAASLDESAQIAVDRIERQWQEWQEQIAYHSSTLTSQQESLVKQYEALTETHRRSESIVAMQETLDANLQRLTATNQAIDRSVSAAAGDGMADAMRILARAVDVLSVHLAQQDSSSQNPRPPKTAQPKTATQKTGKQSASLGDQRRAA